jgi:transcriptional regulator with XRE-family HTH domain
MKAIGADKKRMARTAEEAIGAFLTELRVKKGWSQQKMAEFLGYNQNYVRRLEMGQNSPTLRTLEVLACGFGMDVCDFMSAAKRRMRQQSAREKRSITQESKEQPGNE